MSDHDLDPPELFREALEDGDEGLDELLRLPELLTPIAPGADALGRLMHAVAEPPLRYAPFFERLSRLWNMPEPAVKRVLERSRDAGAWRRAPLRGLRLLAVEGGAPEARCTLAHFAPGLRFPSHRHRGHEALLLLEGSYTDGSGAVYRSGDLHEMAAGSEHEFVVDPHEPCIAAVRQLGIEFSSRWMRFLARWFDG